MHPGMALRVAGICCLVAAARAQTDPLHLSFCDSTNPNQLFYYYPNHSYIIQASTGYCLDVFYYGTTPGSVVQVAPCHASDVDPTHQNQNFSAPATSWGAQSPIISLLSGLAVDSAGALEVGAAITLNTPSSTSPFYLNATAPPVGPNGSTGTLVHVASNLCLDSTQGITYPPPQPVSLMPCGGNRAAFQTFSSAAVPGALALAELSVWGPQICLTSPTLGTSIYGTTCTPGANLSAQAFSFDGTSINVGSYKLKLQVNDSTGFYWGMGMLASPTQSSLSDFTFTPVAGSGGVNGSYAHTASGLCLDAGPLPNSHACLTLETRSLPFCNASLPTSARVADLVGRLTLAEKIALTGSRASPDTCDTVDPGIPRLDVPPMEWLVETNSMVASECYGSTCATSFPSALNLAASFNASVWLAKGEVVGDEMRALTNLAWHRGDTQANTLISLSGQGPDINQPRDPRNGRIGELASEDGLLTGAYALGYVAGQQGGAAGQTGPYLKMSASLKHYVGYSMETNRMGSQGNFTLYDMWDTYLVPFERGYVDGGASGSMCAYISLGGVTAPAGPPYIPACANPYTLTTVVREYWGRPDAYYISDCGAVANMANANHYVSNLTYAAAVSVNAGLDINSNSILPDQLGLAVEMGIVNQSTIDAAVSRTLALRFRLGVFDPLELQPYTQYGLERVGSPEHLAAAYEGAAQGLVLVKNAGATLPLKAGLRLAVVGPLAAAQYALMGDYYADAVCPGASPGYEKGTYDCVPSLNASLTAANVGGQTVSFSGVSISGNDSSWGDALAAVAAADATVLCLGTDQTVAHEGVDRTSIGLPGLQAAFGAAVLAAAAGKPVVLLLVSSFPVSFDSLAGPAPAIVLAYTPAFGAPAVAAALFGVNRWGRATLSVYPEAYTSTISLGDFSMPASATSPGRSYRYYDGSSGPLLVRFGQGLTYSTVGLSCSGGFVAPGEDALAVNCLLASTAGPAGDQVLQVYHRASPDVITRIGGAHPVPLSTLVGFARTALPAGGSSDVDFSLSAATALSLVDETGARVLYPGLHFLDVWDGGANNVTLAVEVPGGVGGTPRVVRRPPPM